MNSPSPINPTTPSASVRASCSPPRFQTKARTVSLEKIAPAPFSPVSNKDSGDVVTRVHTEEANAIPNIASLPLSAKDCLSPSGLSIDRRVDATSQAHQMLCVLSDSKKRKRSPVISKQTIAGTNVRQNELPISKRSHNAIEKRYRTNLNHKISALRDAVPSLRKLGALAAGDDSLASSNKLNKATVMSKAIEYIQHLESRNQRLEEENSSLRECVYVAGQDGNKFVRTRPQAALEVDSDTVKMHVSTTSDATQYPASDTNDPQGMIRVPEEIRRLRQVAPQAHYYGRNTRPLPPSSGVEIYLGAMLRMP